MAIEQDIQIQEAWEKTSKILAKHSAGSINRLFRPSPGSELSRLYYPRLDIVEPAKIDSYHQALRSLDRQLANGFSQTSIMQQMLEEKIQKRLNVSQLIKAATEIQSANRKERVNQKAISSFISTNKALYGEPNLDRVRDVAIAFYRLVERYSRLNMTEDKRRAWVYLKNQIKDDRFPAKKLVRPDSSHDQELAAAIRSWAISRYPREIGIIQRLESTKTYKAKEIQQIFQDLLKSTDWQVVYSRHNLSVSVSATHHKVHLPANFSRSGYDSRTLLAHEYFGHIKRAQNAERIGFGLLQSGLPDYGYFEEPFASLLGRVLGVNQQKIRPRGRELYLAVALAKGHVTGQPLNAPQVYEILWRYLMLRGRKTGSMSTQDYQQQARTLTLRVFRGTPGTIPGLVLTKDIAYFEHFNDVKKAFSDQYRTNQLEQWLDFVMLGKFNPLIESHVQLVNKLKGSAKR